MRKTKNTSHVEGYLYEHKLEKKTSGENSKNPGTEFISGTISIATDDEMLNVVQIHYTYVTAVTSRGKANSTYTTLESIINGTLGSVMQHGKENAAKLRADSAVDLNEWYDMRDPKCPLISVRRNEGGFVHQVQELGPADGRATFDTDILLTNVSRIEADEERHTPERVVLKGYIFNFRGDLLPIEYSVYEPYAAASGMDYFENLGVTAKTPVFTHVQGVQVSKTIIREITEENAFGPPIIKEVRNTQRDFVVNWASPETYDIDDSETGITADELKTKAQEREVRLAESKQRSAEYHATKGNAMAGGTKSSTSAPAKGGYDF